MVADDHVRGDQRRLPSPLRGDHRQARALLPGEPQPQLQLTVAERNVRVRHQRHVVLVDRQLGQELRQDVVVGPVQGVLTPGRADQHQLAAVGHAQRAPVALPARQMRDDPVETRISRHRGDGEGFWAVPREPCQLVLMGQGDGGGHHPAVMDQLASGQARHLGAVAVRGAQQAVVAGTVRHQQQRGAEAVQFPVGAGGQREVEPHRHRLCPRHGFRPGRSQVVVQPVTEGRSLHGGEQRPHAQVGPEQRENLEQSSRRGHVPGHGQDAPVSVDGAPAARRRSPRCRPILAAQDPPTGPLRHSGDYRFSANTYHTA